MKRQNWKTKRAVMRHYGDLASIYDELYGDEQQEKIETALRLVDMTGSNVVLDVGCGTGLLLQRMRNSDGLFVAVDLSKGLLKVAATKSQHLNTNEFHLVQADADFLPLQDSTFNRVFALTILQNMPDPVATLLEIVRVTKNGSLVVVTGLKKSYTEKSIVKMLQGVRLRSCIVTTNERSKDIIVICLKTDMTKDKRINRGRSM